MMLRRERQMPLKQKQISKFRFMRTSIKYFFFLCFIFSTMLLTSQEDTSSKQMVKMKYFAEHYKPTYIVGSDTLVVSVFTPLSDDLNKFLFKCIEKNNFYPLKYCVLILRKQREEYQRKNKEDYMLSNPNYSNIAYLEMIRVFLKLERDKEVYLEPNFTGDLCRMVDLKKDKVEDYNYIKVEEQKSKGKKKK